MKPLFTFMLSAMLTAGATSKPNKMSTSLEAERQAAIKLEISELVKELKHDWYLPGKHTVILYLKPSQNNQLEIDSIATGDIRLQRFLENYFKGAQINVLSTSPVLVQLLLD